MGLALDLPAQPGASLEIARSQEVPLVDGQTLGFLLQRNTALGANTPVQVFWVP